MDVANPRALSEFRLARTVVRAQELLVPRWRMASSKQTAAARKNIKKAARAARRKRTIAHLSKATRTALGKQGAKVAKQKRGKR
jgi:hypothetical protein